MNDHQKGQFGILDLIAPLIEAWWLLLLAPIIFGAAAYYVGRPAVTHYEMRLLVDAPHALAGELTLPAVTSPTKVVVLATVGPTQKTTFMLVRASSAEDAKSAVQNIAAYIEGGRFDPMAASRAALQSKLAIHNESVTRIRKAMEQIASASPGATTGKSDDALASYVTAVARLTNDLQAQELAKIDLRTQIDAMPTGKVLSVAPAATPIIESRSALVPFSALAGLLTAVFVIALKEVLANAVRLHPESDGLKRIRRMSFRRATT